MILDDSGFLEECASRRGMSFEEFMNFSDGFDDGKERDTDKVIHSSEQISG